MNDSNKIIVVTGGSRGLGLGIVTDLLEHNYAVATGSRNPSDALNSLLKSYPEKLFWAPCTLGSPESEKQFMDATLEWARERPIWGLVNNAGIAHDGVLATMPIDAIDQVLDTNLKGALRMSRLAIRSLLTQASGGRIINISSIVGQRGYGGLAAYAASKAGLDGMTRALARELGQRLITINAIAPGFLETDLSAKLDEKQRNQIVRRTPLKRLGQVSDVVPIVRFLLSTDADFITGQTWTVDGGLTC